MLSRAPRPWRSASLRFRGGRPLRRRACAHRESGCGCGYANTSPFFFTLSLLCMGKGGRTGSERRDPRPACGVCERGREEKRPALAPPASTPDRSCSAARQTSQNTHPMYYPYTHAHCARLPAGLQALERLCREQAGHGHRPGQTASRRSSRPSSAAASNSTGALVVRLRPGHAIRAYVLLLLSSSSSSSIGGARRWERRKRGGAL